jgi:RNA polymerase sigma-70 factor, ECF subfamily
MTAQPAATVPSAPAAGFRFSAALAAAVEHCWRRADAPAEWGLARREFEAALERSAGHRFPGASPDNKQVEAYLDGLHARDLALARACSAGNEAAWEVFVAEYRQELYRAARAITGKADSYEPAARELADSLYADLYGLRESSGGRKSLLDYFHGRSRLSTWLRAVLAQRYVDEIRRTQKTQPIEGEDGEERLDLAARARTSMQSGMQEAALDVERAKHTAVLQVALVTALDALAPRERLRLAYYYADERTLAEIGRLLGEHEATVSRKLDRTRRDLRRAVEAALRDGKKLSDAQVQACFDYAREHWPFDLTGRLRSE